MSRSGYSEDGDQWQMIKWRGAVASAFRGRRGQAFLREMRDALDALPVKRLLRDELVQFGIAHAMACEIMYENDEREAAYNETPEQRFVRMWRWVEAWTS